MELKKYLYMVISKYIYVYIYIYRVFLFDDGKTKGVSGCIQC